MMLPRSNEEAPTMVSAASVEISASDIGKVASSVEISASDIGKVIKFIFWGDLWIGLMNRRIDRWPYFFS